MAASDNVKAPVARLAFANLLVPGERIDQKTKAKKEHWNCNLLWPKGVELLCVSQTGDKILLRDLIIKVGVEAFGSNATEMLKNGALKSPLLDGDGPQAVSKKTGQRYSGFEGCVFVRAGSNQRPKMVTKALEAVTSGDEMYAGCYVSPVINAYSWVADTGRGVSIGLSMLQVVKDGERLGGQSANPEDFFDRIPDEGGAPAPQNGDGASALFT